LSRSNGVLHLKRSTTAATAVARHKADDHARRLLAVIFELRGAGVTSLGAIAAELNRRGVSTAQGGSGWKRATVARLLERLGRFPVSGRAVAAASYHRQLVPLIQQLGRRRV
jgi:hypothetical protein